MAFSMTSSRRRRTTSTATPRAPSGPVWGATAFQIAPALDRTKLTMCRRKFISNFDHGPGSRSTRVRDEVLASFRTDDDCSQHGLRARHPQRRAPLRRALRARHAVGDAGDLGGRGHLTGMDAQLPVAFAVGG